MKKRCFTILLLAVWFLLLFPLAAYADVLIEPDNDFYTRHRDACTALRRSFYANGESGAVSVKKEPGSKTETAVIENGEVINIMFTYNHKGEIWGVTEIYTEGKRPNGWIPMDQLLLVYDYISFSEEHQDDFYAYTGSYEALKTAEEIVLWSWPGSGDTQGNFETLSDENSENFSLSPAYRDGQGREWGFIAYWHQYRNVWVCISDPTNSDIPAFNPPPQPELWQPDDTNAPKSGRSTPLLIIILVTLLVASTAILIRVFWKPNQGKRPS
ncbi:MAG: hypothetical protein LBL15_01690 [Oscillospiraceae bacterium]|jgi:hypothetical protein|nr:hypothetical protein [Oscillospiraceae bacterium]